MRATEEDIELTTTWKTIKMTEDWKLLLCKLPVSRVLQEDYTKNEEYRFLNLAISWILLGLLANPIFYGCLIPISRKCTLDLIF